MSVSFVVFGGMRWWEMESWIRILSLISSVGYRGVGILPDILFLRTV